MTHFELVGIFRRYKNQGVPERDARESMARALQDAGEQFRWSHPFQEKMAARWGRAFDEVYEGTGTRATA